MKKLFLLLLILSLMLCCTSCSSEKSSTIDYDDAQIVASRIAEMYSDEIRWTGEDASAILYCYADKNSGEHITEEELRKAIWEMLEYYDATNEYFSQMSSGELLDDIKDIYGDYEE